MASTIEKSHVEQFKANVIHLASQKMSRLRSTVMEEAITGKTYNFERVGSIAAVKKLTRHAATPVMDVPHSRRKVNLEDYQWGDVIDAEDKIRMLISPESAYAREGAAAMARAIDDAIIAAALGNALDGDNATVALPASQQIAASASGLTLAKIRAAKEILDENEADPSETRYLVVAGAQVNNLLASVETNQSDYWAVKAIVEGKADQFYGFTVVRTQRLPVASGTRSCLAYTDRAMGLAVGRDVVTRIAERSDLSFATQVYLAMSLGATRVQDGLMVKIDCTET